MRKKLLMEMDDGQPSSFKSDLTEGISKGIKPAVIVGLIMFLLLLLVVSQMFKY